MAAYKRAKNLTWKGYVLRYFMIVLGSIIYTVGLDVFLVPNNIIDGGVVGISLMASSITGLSFSFFVVVVNLPFLYLGYKLIGKRFTIATLFGVVCISVISLFMHNIAPLTIDPFLASIFGGIILGIGVGLIIRNGGSLDGTEIVAIIMDKKKYLLRWRNRNGLQPVHPRCSRFRVQLEQRHVLVNCLLYSL